MQAVPDPSSAVPTLLNSREQPPYSVYNPQGQSGLVLVCDHAKNAIPRSLGTLGLSQAALNTHIALDIGCEALSVAIADRLDSVLVMGGFSRLVVDLNRHPEHPTSIPLASDGVEIPGNRQLSGHDRRQRIDEVFSPYHKALAAEVQRVGAQHPRIALISLHSFTPYADGASRPWHLSILWNKDQRLSRPLLEGLRREAGLCIGDNQPYDARKYFGYTVDAYANINTLAHVMIEARQDILDSKDGIAKWADLLATQLRRALPACGVFISN
ncbi:MAG: N-formylglutamate amidohydrolase [Acidiferrobacteraceae bacterium]|nr:N-formylglutamate amidohydrolase [Acidiferrobacteraceae bacterium]